MNLNVLASDTPVYQLFVSDSDQIRYQCSVFPKFKICMPYSMESTTTKYMYLKTTLNRQQTTFVALAYQELFQGNSETHGITLETLPYKRKITALLEKTRLKKESDRNQGKTGVNRWTFTGWKPLSGCIKLCSSVNVFTLETLERVQNQYSLHCVSLLTTRGCLYHSKGEKLSISSLNYIYKSIYGSITMAKKWFTTYAQYKTSE